MHTCIHSIASLSDELVLRVLGWLASSELCRFGSASTTFTRFSRHDILWSKLGAAYPLCSRMSSNNSSLWRLYAQRMRADSLITSTPACHPTTEREKYLVGVEIKDPFGAPLCHALRSIAVGESTPELIVQEDVHVPLGGVPWFFSGVRKPEECHGSSNIAEAHLWPTLQAYLIRQSDNAILPLFITDFIDGGGEVDDQPQYSTTNQEEVSGWATFQVTSNVVPRCGVIRVLWDVRVFTQDKIIQTEDGSARGLTTALTGFRIALANNDHTVAKANMCRWPYFFTVDQLLEHLHKCPDPFLQA